MINTIFKPILKNTLDIEKKSWMNIGIFRQLGWGCLCKTNKMKYILITRLVPTWTSYILT